jgi:hypothetical protein
MLEVEGLRTADRSERERIAMELSRMISELNEVRMRLDAVVRKMADTTREETSDDDSVEMLERLRLTLASQLDRIRQKLVARIPEEA